MTGRALLGLGFRVHFLEPVDLIQNDGHSQNRKPETSEAVVYVLNPKLKALARNIVC